MSNAADGVPVLTYHSQNVAGADYATNDHCALQKDLQIIADLGLDIIPLRLVAEWHAAGQYHAEDLKNCVALTFDDGTDFDVFNLEFPPHGVQPSFAEILREHSIKRDVSVHATCFVMASPEARHDMDRECLFGRGQISDTWWRDADESGILAIENHGWDHNHPAVKQVVQREQITGGFTAIDTAAECQSHVLTSADYIAGITARQPVLFAYPFGESSTYMRTKFMPQRRVEHGLMAAFGTHGRHVQRQDDRWNLPRYVCGEHWNSADELQAILDV